jgi:hypothetical protein
MINDGDVNEEEGIFFPDQPRRPRARILLAIVIPALLLLAGGAGYFSVYG